MLDNTELNDKLVSELREIAKTYGVEDAETLRKQDLITRIKEQQNLPLPEKQEVNNEAAEPVAEKPKKRARTLKSKTPEKAPEKNPRCWFICPAC